MQPGAGTADAFDGADKFHLQHGFFLSRMATGRELQDFPEAHHRRVFFWLRSSDGGAQPANGWQVATPLKWCSYNPM
jgi:hypothetical protein